MEKKQLRKQLWTTFQAKRKLILALGILLVFLLLLGSFFVSAFLVVITLLSSFFINVAHLKKSGFELVTLSTVLFGVVYGSKIGAIMGMILVTIELLAGQHLDIYVLWVIPGYALAGFLASILALDITTLGITIAVGLNIFFVIMTLLITPPHIGKYFPFAVMNIVMNVIIFKLFAPIILELMM